MENYPTFAWHGFMDEQLRQWRKDWLDALNQLTDIELQKTSWLDMVQTNQHWSFIEFMCTYFDDLYLRDNYLYQLHNGTVTLQEYTILFDWHMALSQYKEPKDVYDPYAILNDPLWIEIVKMGVAAKEELLSILDDEEKAILKEKTDYKKFI